MNNSLLQIGTGALAVLNISVSIFLLRRIDLNTFQKAAQIVLVWIIPVAGALCIWLFNRGHDEHRGSSEGAFGGGSNDGGGIGEGNPGIPTGGNDGAGGGE